MAMDNQTAQIIYDYGVAIEAINSLLVKKGIYTNDEVEQEQANVKKRKTFVDLQEVIDKSKAEEEKIRNMIPKGFLDVFSIFDDNGRE